MKAKKSVKKARAKSKAYYDKNREKYLARASIREGEKNLRGIGVAFPFALRRSSNKGCT